LRKLNYLPWLNTKLTLQFTTYTNSMAAYQLRRLRPQRVGQRCHLSAVVAYVLTMKETTMKRRLVSLGGTILLGLGMSAAYAEDADAALNRAAAERVAVGTCATCHGPHGHSFSPKFPVLAGQHAGYLVAQLQAFKAQTRGDPDALGYMWGMAAPLSDQLMASLADYYSRQSPIAGPAGAAALITRGEEIYQKGDAGAGIPPCGVCHGATAAGTDGLSPTRGSARAIPDQAIALVPEQHAQRRGDARCGPRPATQRHGGSGDLSAVARSLNATPAAIHLIGASTGPWYSTAGNPKQGTHPTPLVRAGTDRRRHGTSLPARRGMKSQPPVN
jgi:cytochrome c553